MKKGTADKEQWIDRVMQSVEGITPAAGNPFLFQKVLSKLAAPQDLKVSSRVVWLTASLILVMVIINLSIMMRNLETFRRDPVEAVAAEYGFVTTDIYSSATDNTSDHE